MHLTLIAFSCLISSLQADFSAFLAVRDFDTALEAAGDSDSLQAMVFREAGDYSLAAMLFEKAFQEDPSAGLFAEIWKTVALSADYCPSLVAVTLREQLLELEGTISFGPADLQSLIESAAAFEDTTAADSLSLVLLDQYPESMEAAEIIGWEFYDNLYPVWNDDSARVTVLREFLDEWGDSSEFWQSMAWQYILSAVLETGDSLYWKDYHRQWLDACPGNPQAYLSGAALFIDRDSSWAEALELSVHGLEILRAGWKPIGMPAEEWLLTGPALESGLQFRRLFALAGSGRHREALTELSGVISETDFDTNDYHTEASLYWLEGKLKLAEGDTSGAISSFTASAISGEVMNRWSGLAISSMDSILQHVSTPIERARMDTGYSGPVFENRTYLLGPDSLRSGTRVSWCDWNSDGYPDLFAGRTLFQNNEGTSFTDVTLEAGLSSCHGNGGIWGDLNRDGQPDLVTSGNPVQVFASRNGRLEDVTGSIGIENTDSAVEGVALLDWNADGWLDLYLASYEKAGSTGSGTEDYFYLGSEEGFTSTGDIIGMVPFLEEHLCGRGVSPCDFDLDGDMDIFVSNYRLQENFLWENSNGTAVNSALSRGVAGTNNEGWWGHTIGSAWGDFDNDGDWDLFSANLAHPRYISFSDMSMLLEQDNGSFSDSRYGSGIRFEETLSNPLWGDFNNDGWLDLYITSVYQDRRSFLYMNSGDGTFEDVTWLSGSRVLNGWGAAAADFNLDGRLDLAVGSGNGPLLFENITPGGNWMLVDAEPPDGTNPSALGCIVRIDQEGVSLIRQVEGGSGTTSQNSGTLHFGLPSDRPCRITLYLPGDSAAVIDETVNADSHVRLQESD
jgi:hypothetical protein